MRILNFEFCFVSAYKARLKEKRRILKHIRKMVRDEDYEHVRTLHEWEFCLLELPDTPEVRQAYTQGVLGGLIYLRGDLERERY